MCVVILNEISHDFMFIVSNISSSFLIGEYPTFGGESTKEGEPIFVTSNYC